MPSVRLTPEILEHQGIIYDETVINSHDLNHVNALREGLLDFDGFLSRDVVRDLLLNQCYNCDEIPRSAFRNSGRIEQWEREVLLEFVETAREICNDTEQLELGLCPELSWQYLFKKTAFKPRKDPRSSKLFAEQISSVSDGTTLWNEAHSIRDLNKAPTLPTIPKPDIYFGFRIYDVNHYRHHGFAKVDSFQNFTTRMLFHLKREGLCPAPTSGFATCMKERAEKNKTKSIAQHHLLCFPWAVVELKKFEGNKSSPARDAYCQAANDSSTALCMLERLTKHSGAKQNNQHIPPVVTFTCIGGKSKVWLAYSHPTSDSKRDHRMICIWEGSLSKIWDAIQFCRIVDNVSSWAQNILRPQISECIDQWRAKPPIPSNSSIIHQSEGQGALLSLSDSSHPSGLVQSVTTLEEFAITTQTATSVENESKAEHGSPLYATIQETGSYQVISNKIVENKRSLLSLPFGEAVDEHTFAEPASVRSETTESLPRFSQEAKNFDVSTTIFEGSRQKPFGLFNSITTATVDSKTLGFTPSKMSMGCRLSTEFFLHRPYFEYGAENHDYFKDAFQSISFWPEYRNYSPEELRLADYTQSRRFCNHGSFDIAAALNASNINLKSSSFASATKRPLLGSTQPPDRGLGANTTTSATIFGNQSQKSSFSGTLFGSILASNVVFGKQQKTDPTSSGIPGIKIESPPPRGLFGSRKASEGLPGKQKEAQSSSTDTFTVFGNKMRASWDLDHGKITRPDKTELAFDFPLVSQSKDLAISANEDLKQVKLDWHVFSEKIFDTTQVNNVGPLKKEELAVLAKTISSFTKSNTVPSPRNGKNHLSAGNSEGLTSLPSSELMNLNLRTTDSPASNSSAEQVCESGMKRNNNEIEATDSVLFGNYKQLSDMYSLTPKKTGVRLPQGKIENKFVLKLPIFITGDGSLNITHFSFGETGYERYNQEEKMSVENVNSDEEDDDKDWEDIDSDGGEPEFRAGYQASQDIRRATLNSQARKEIFKLKKRKGGTVVKQRRVRTRFPNRNF